MGHEGPTLLLTNQLTATAARLIERYAQRMIIENRIADGIDFFHMDALSSAVAMKVNCDLQLTLMASSLYRLLAGRIGRG
ncbi:MAG: transposase, partial [Isosphaeraceae bacterium]